MLFSSSVPLLVGLSYDLSIAALKLSLHPRPLMIRERGLFTLISAFRVAAARAVWRLSRELDFLRPSEGPTFCPEEPWEKKGIVSIMHILLLWKYSVIIRRLLIHLQPCWLSALCPKDFTDVCVSRVSNICSYFLCLCVWCKCGSHKWQTHHMEHVLGQIWCVVAPSSSHGDSDISTQ